MKITLTKKVLKYIKCPACKDTNGFELNEEQVKPNYDAGVLYCTNCGYGIICKIIDEYKVEIKEFTKKYQPIFVLLRLSNHPEPIYVVIRSSKTFNKVTKKYRDEEDIEDAFMESDQVIFDFLLDPIMYLQDIVCIIKKDFDEPKQFLEYMATVETDDTTTDFEENDFREKFKDYIKD